MIAATQTTSERFMRQCNAAQRAGLDHFIDQDTKTLIAIDPMTGIPGAFGLWVRALRLQRQANERRWTRRAARCLRRIFHMPRKAQPTKDASIDRT